MNYHSQASASQVNVLAKIAFQITIRSWSLLWVLQVAVLRVVVDVLAGPYLTF